MAKAGLEPARSYLQRGLSSQRLPFRHLALTNHDRAIRTPDLRIPNAALHQAELYHDIASHFYMGGYAIKTASGS